MPFWSRNGEFVGEVWFEKSQNRNFFRSNFFSLIYRKDLEHLYTLSSEMDWTSPTKIFSSTIKTKL